MKNCVGYVRVSTAKQGEGVSLDAQREAILAFSERNGITIVKWFEEKETAAKRGRPVFSAMLRELRQRRADGVVLHKVDRGARNAFDWARIGQLSDAGIDVHFAAESLDFRSRGGRLTADIQAVIAADYIRNLREETIKGLYGRLKQGIYPLKAPIGYLDNGGGKLKTIDPARGPLVRHAFELYASGQFSIRSLQSELRRLGLRTASGKPLSKGCIERMLGNPFYAGVMRIRRSGQTFRGLHEPLISVTTFKAVQDVKAGKAVKKVTRHNHTYRGLFRCGRCNNSMIAERQKGHVYYRCQQAACPTNCIREEALVEATAALLELFVLPESAIEAIAKAVERWAATNHRAAEVQVATVQLRQLESRLEQLTDALVDRLIDKETFNRRKEKMLIEQAGLEERLASARQQAASPQMMRRFLERLKSLAEHYRLAPPDEKREIMSITTSNRSVWGKNAYVEPSDWLKPAHEALGVLYCGRLRPKDRTSPQSLDPRKAGSSENSDVLFGAQPRPTPRRIPRLRDKQIEVLVAAANTEGFACLNTVLERQDPRSEAIASTC